MQSQYWTDKRQGEKHCHTVGRALIREKVLKLGSKDIDIIGNSNAYNTKKDYYLCKEEEQLKLPEGIQSANGLQAQVGVRKEDGKRNQQDPEK